MKWQIRLILLPFVIGLFGSTPIFAGQALLLPRDSEARWTLVSPPMSGAPVENEGTQLMNAPVQVVMAKPVILKRSPADAYRARMAAQQMHLALPYASDTINYPDPVHLPLNVKEINQEL